jgi:hypothetical protein
MEKQRKVVPFPVEFIRRSVASGDEEAIVCSLVLAGGEGKETDSPHHESNTIDQ